ncbi:MAG: hypothetical protein WAN48_11995 [Actinomycetes bacterium]
MLMAAVMGDLNAPAHYLHWNWILISYANLAVIITMVVVFVLALLLPFPKSKDKE